MIELNIFDVLRWLGLHVDLQAAPDWVKEEYVALLRAYDYESHEQMLIPLRNEQEFNKTLTIILETYQADGRKEALTLLLGSLSF